ncbi:helix-turn-helix domain-containing protein [Streptomyces sp. NPDC007818]|uniref:helix-turn-helix domain-containing protein n=1 Tax=Streptomyces sp. NPDC007818 TaxID=3364780 RepID=UPI0036849ED1
MPPADDPYALPPFDSARAAAIRRQLGLTTGQVAWAVAAYCGSPVHPDLLRAWEAGTVTPENSQVKALAAALWCSPADLVGEASTLAQCRTVAGLTVNETAAALGITRGQWERAERRNHWRGTAAQTQALLRTLCPPPPCFVAACGRTEQLRVLLREAVTTWWPPYVGPLARIVPLDPALLHHALELLHRAYQHWEGATGGPVHQAARAEARAADFLEHIDRHLWQHLREALNPADDPSRPTP